MSIIRVDNFGPSAGGTTYSARGIAKAWVNFNGTGTIAARDSENVSSLTDNGAGDYTVTFSNAFGAADEYNFSGGARLDSGAANEDFPIIGAARRTTYLATSFRVVSVFRSSATTTATLQDPDIVAVTFHGDLA